MKTLTRTSYEPNGAGSDPDCLAGSGLVWSGPVRPASSLLWTNGRPGRPVTEILQKRHMRDTCSFSRHLCQSHGDGGMCHVPGVNCASHTYLLNVRSCIFIQPPPAEERREEVLNVAFQSFIQVFFKHRSPLQLPSSTYFKMWTSQSNTSMSNLM